MVKVFACKRCKCGFYYTKDKGKDKTCEHCGKSTLKLLPNYEIFECPECGNELQVIQLEMIAGGVIKYKEDEQDHRFRKRVKREDGNLDVGELRCQEDGGILKWQPDEDEEGLLEEEFKEDKSAWKEILQEDFQEHKRKMQKLEAEILTAAGFKPRPMVQRGARQKRKFFSVPDEMDLQKP